MTFYCDKEPVDSVQIVYVNSFAESSPNVSKSLKLFSP